MERFSGFDDKNQNKPFVSTARGKRKTGALSILSDVVFVWPPFGLFALFAGLGIALDAVASVRAELHGAAAAGTEHISLVEALKQSTMPFPKHVGGKGGDETSDADADEQAGQALDSASGRGWHWLAGGRAVVVFPEAGRTNATTVLEFAPGAEALARCIARRQHAAPKGKSWTPRTHLIAMQLPQVVPTRMGKGVRGGASGRGGRKSANTLRNRVAHDPEGDWLGLACRLAVFWPTGGLHAQALPAAVDPQPQLEAHTAKDQTSSEADAGTPASAPQSATSSTTSPGGQSKSGSRAGPWCAKAQHAMAHGLMRKMKSDFSGQDHADFYAFFWGQVKQGRTDGTNTASGGNDDEGDAAAADASSPGVAGRKAGKAPSRPSSKAARKRAYVGRDYD